MLAASGALAQTSEVSQHYENAVRYFADGEPVAAVIELKNALQMNPDHVPSVLLRGEIYLDQGLGDAAETSFRRALELGADRSRCMVLLAKAMLAQRKNREMLEEVHGEGLAPSSLAEIHALRAEANIILARIDEAERELDVADQLAPGTLSAQLVRVVVLIHRERLEQAALLADALLTQAPQRSEVWNVAASVAHARGQLELALERYGQSIDIDPRNGDARIGRLGLLIDLGRDAEASGDLAYFGEHHPSEPRANYLRALKLARAGDDYGAREALETTAYVLSNFHDDELFRRNSPLLLIAALTHYGLGNPEQTARYAESYLTLRPDHVGARRLLGDALLRSGRINLAVRELSTALTYEPDDLALVTLAATAYGRAGRYESASRLLERLIEARGDDPMLRTRHAAMEIGAGEVAAGIDALSRLVEQDPNAGAAGLTLMVTYQQAGDYEKAIEIGDLLVVQNPGNLSIRNLLGVSYYLQDDFEAAAVRFGECLAADDEFLPAAINAAKVEVAQGKLDVARGRLSKLAASYPENARIQLERSRLENVAGNARAALAHAVDARRLAAEDIYVMRNLVNLHLAQGNLSEADSLSRSASSSATSELEARELRVRVLIAMGNYADARGVLVRMADFAGQSAPWLVRIAAYQADIGYPADAAYSLRTALGSDPLNLEAHLGLIEQLLAQKEPTAALQAAQAAIKAFPDDAQVHLLFGEAYFASGDHRAALRHFDQALEIQALELAVVRGAHAQTLLGNLEAARARLDSWLEEHPGDDSVLNVLAELELTAGDRGRASEIYQQLVERNPDDVRSLNNLAFSLHAIDDDRAVEYARRAVSIAPDDASVNDTLGWILVSRGSADEALGFLREASTREWNDPEIRYHLAACLAALGRTSEAMQEVRVALAAPELFEEREAATELLDTLKGHPES